MASEGGERGGEAGGAIRPGQLSALLQEIAAAPTPSDGGWGAALLPGATIGKFELVREIGSGGFGVVWEAQDRELGRSVAFKAVRAGGKAGLREERLLREAEAAARLSHPNLVTLFDMGRSEAGPYLVLELLAGQTLEERLAQGPLPLREAVRIAAEIAKGVAHAHQHGVVHRDLKPANVFLCDDGQVKVLDFGLAHAFGQRRQDGGTPAYMAPEQWDAAPEDERTDVFALGVLLFRMLAGELPFPDDAGRAVRGPGKAPAVEVPDAPALGSLVARLLEKRAAARPRDGAEVASALRGIQGELERTATAGASPVTTRPQAGLPGLLAELRRRRVVPAMVGYGTFALLAVRGVDWASQSGRLSGWASAMAMGLLALGFPATLLLAWRYDLTGQGIRRTPPRTGADPLPRRRKVALLAAVGLLAAVPALVYTLLLRERASGSGSLAPDAEGRIRVAVADFANQTGEPALDALSGLLITSLEQSPRLRVITRGRMFDLLRQLGRENVERIDEAVARELGARAGARALLLGSVARLGGRYVAELRALDPEKDHYLFTLREDAPDQAGLLPLLDRLSARARERLDGSQAGAASLRLAVAVTPSLEAYRHYFKGKELSARFDTESAMKEYQAALALEPRFAMAQYELVLMAKLTAASGTEVIRQAAREAERSPEKEAGQIRTLEALVAGRFPEAAAGAARLSARFPEDADVAFLASFIMEMSGDFEGALPLLERVLKLQPDNRIIEVERFYVLHLLLRGAEARAAAAELLRRDPSPASRLSAAVERALAGDLRGAVRGFEEAGGGAEQGWAIWFRAQTLAALGRSGEALAAFGTDRGYLLDLMRASALAYAGQLRQGRELLLGAARDPAAGAQQMAFNLALYLAAAGDQEGARRAVPEGTVMPAYEPLLLFEVGDDARLRAALRGGLLPASLGGRLCQALVDWREGRRGEALDGLRELDRSHGWFVPFYRGVLAAELGLHQEAAEALGRFAEPMLIEMDSMAHGWLQARARIQLARSLEALGRRDEAVRHLERQLALWQDADPDLPLLVEAKELRARLARSPAPAKGPAASAPTPSIAVLPFADMSPGKDQEYFADGVAEEILNALTQVPGLKVIGRTSSFSFKGKSADLKAIGRKLGAGALLEGSVRKDGARLRVTAKLVRAADGAGTWSRTFEGDQGTIFAVQDEIARSVVKALRVSLEPGRTGNQPLVARALPSRPTRTDRPEVYASYLRGREQYRRGTPESLRQALASFEQALAREPGYAPAWAGVSEAAFLLFDADPTVADLRERALSAAEKAIALAPDLADGYYARAVVRLWYRFDWAGAEADLLKVAALNPGHGRGPSVRGRLLAALGRTRDGLAVAAEATAIDPLDPEVWVNLGVARSFAGDLAGARAAYDRAHRLAPAHYLATGFLCAALVADGKPGEALALAERSGSEVLRLLVAALARHDLGERQAAQGVLESLEGRYAKWGAYFIASVHAWREENDRAFEWLERAWQERDAGLANVRRDPLFRKVHGDPRWRELLRKLNLPVD